MFHLGVAESLVKPSGKRGSAAAVYSSILMQFEHFYTIPTLQHAQHNRIDTQYSQCNPIQKQVKLLSSKRVRPGSEQISARISESFIKVKMNRRNSHFSSFSNNTRSGSSFFLCPLEMYPYLRSLRFENLIGALFFVCFYFQYYQMQTLYCFKHVV